MPNDDPQVAVPGPELLTKRETCAELGVPLRTLDRWIAADAIPFVKLPNGRVYFRRSDVDAVVVK